MQVSSVKALMGELRTGLKKVDVEIVKAADCAQGDAQGHSHFAELMVVFHRTAKMTFEDLEVQKLP